MGTRKVNLTMTSSEGCIFRIKGEVDYSIIPPRINHFNGTVQVSGGEGCPHGTFNFSLAAPGDDGQGGDRTKNPDIALQIDQRNIYTLQQIKWVKFQKQVPEGLNSQIVLKTIVAELKDLEKMMSEDQKVLSSQKSWTKDGDRVSIEINVHL
jgi:hypothetical protein